MQERPIYELSDEELVNNRIGIFQDDADWRSACIGANHFQDCVNLYESQGIQAGSTNIPDMGNIKEAVDDAVSVATENMPKVRLDPVEPIDEEDEEARLELIMRQHQSVNVLDRYIKTLMAWNQHYDLRAHALKQAGIYGYGALYVGKDERVDTRYHHEARKMAKKPLSSWTERDWERYEQLRNMIKSTYINADQVFFHQGVRSFFDDDMYRVSLLEKKDMGYMRASYGRRGKNIRNVKPGKGNYFVDLAPRANDWSRTVGVLTTWELVPNEVAMERGPEGDPFERVYFNDWFMLKTVIAGGELLEKKVWDGTEGPLSLPLVPVYLMESEKHPFGFPMTVALKAVQQFLNYLYLMVFQQGKKAVAPQTIFMALSQLSAEDSIEEWEKKLYEGGIIPVEAPDGDEVFDIRKYIQNAQQVAQPGLSNAYKEMIALATQQFQRKSLTPDREAISRARSGRGKAMEFSAADRTKSPMVDIISRSEEAVVDLYAENVRVFHNRQVSKYVKKPEGGVEQVELNKPRTLLLPELDEQGYPRQDVRFYDPQNNPAGFVHREVRYLENSTQIEVRAMAEGRGVLPVSWEARVVALSALLQQGAIQSPRTVAQLALPEEITSVDAANVREDREQQLELQDRQLAMQAAYDQKTPAGEGRTGTTNMNKLLAGAAPAQTLEDYGTEEVMA